MLVVSMGWGVSFAAAASAPSAQDAVPNAPGLVPNPVGYTLGSGEFALSEQSLIEMTTAEAAPAAELLMDGVRRVTARHVQLRMARISEQDPASSILLDVRPFDGQMADRAEAYSLQVKPNQVTIRGGDAAGLAMGVARFLQLLRSPLDGSDLLSISRTIPFTVPCVTIIDAPDTEWRGVMIDVARFPHKIADVREVVELAWLTGLNRVHLHLTDDQYFTFPSKAFPELASKGRDGERLHFTRHELLELVEFAHARGVVLVPEIDMPAHAGVMVRARPDLFGTTDPKTGESRSTGIVNMASERAYEALDVLIGEVCEVFSRSPYIHLGADEVGAGHLRDLPEYEAYVRKHKLPRAINGDVGELYCHFVARACEMVRKRDRRPVVWEGFSGAGTEAAPIPSDVLIMAWNLTYQTPDSLIKNGFEIINCGWDPLYVVPAQCWAATIADALDWEVRELRQRLGGPRYTLPAEAPVLGAQMCIWEQRPDAILPASYEIMAAVSERMWNAETPKDEAGHVARRAALDRVVQRMLRPQAMFELSRSGASEAGLPREVPRDKRAYSWNAAWPIPLGTGKLLDVHELGVQARGSMAHTDAARITEVNRELFARVAPLGHIDTRIPAQPQTGLEWLSRRHWQPYAIELDGVIEIPKSGEWSFTVRANDGAAELRLADSVVAISRSNRPAQGVGKLNAGLYHFRIRFHFEYVQNELNIQVQGPGMDQPMAFDDLVLTVTEYQAKAAESATSTILMAASKLSFHDPSKVIVPSLATGKPIVSSAGHQGPHIPDNAVDGVLGNESGWHCGESPASLTVDLGQEHPVNRVQVFPYHDGGRYYQYSVEASLDGKQWAQVVDASTNTTRSSAQGFEHRFAVTPARYLRLTMLKNSANPGVHVNEFLVFADGAAPSVQEQEAKSPPTPAFGRQLSETGIKHAFLITGSMTALLDEESRVVWKVDARSRDGWVLESGNLLISHNDNVVREYTRDGKVVWKYKLSEGNSEIGTAVRLADGYTMVVERGVRPQIVEVGPKGEVRVRVPLQPDTDNAHMQTRMARKLPNGNYLVPHLLAFAVKEYQPDGKVVRTIRTDLEELGGREKRNWPFTAIRLANGNTLVNLTNGNKTVEFDAEGKVVWRVDNSHVDGRFADPCGGQRLANGNTVICAYGQRDPEMAKIFEITRDKKVVWEYINPDLAGIHEVHVVRTNSRPVKSPSLK